MTRAESAVEAEIVQAQHGDLQPLLNRVEAGVTMVARADGPDPGDDGDGAWYLIQTAHADGDLTDEQYSQLYRAAKPL